MVGHIRSFFSHSYCPKVFLLSPFPHLRSHVPSGLLPGFSHLHLTSYLRHCFSKSKLRAHSSFRPCLTHDIPLRLASCTFLQREISHIIECRYPCFAGKDRAQRSRRRGTRHDVALKSRFSACMAVRAAYRIRKHYN